MNGITEEEIRTCKICGVILGLNAKNFYSQKKSSDVLGEYIYFNPECKDCTKSRSIKWQNANKDKKAEHFKTWYQNGGKKIKNEHDKKYRENGGYDRWRLLNRDKLRGYSTYRNLHKTHKISAKEWDCCKKYFDYCCAYCGFPAREHREKYRQDLHKEHVDHDGSNDITNCIPSCKSCNSKKWEYSLDSWYNESKNKDFSQERMERIKNWLEIDCTNCDGKEVIS